MAISKTIPRNNVDYKLKKVVHKKEVKALYALRPSTQGLDRLELDDEINNKVIEFNTAHPRGRAYFDLHGMTRNGAMQFVEAKVEWMRWSGVKIVKLETGRGNHSINNIPVIRNVLLEEFDGKEDVTIEPDKKNPGVLVLTIRRFHQFGPSSDNFDEMFPKL